MLEDTTDDFQHKSPAEQKTYGLRYIQFSAAGRASLPAGEERNIILVMRGGDVNDASGSTNIKNWYQFSIDSLTGRAHVYRP